jgi:GH24 family phage-related lysozyme (muramidase)
MKQAVEQVFPAFTEHYEGHVSWPYLDVEGLVTVARGNLIDPVSLALPLPWNIGGYAVTGAEVEQDWAAVKAQTSWTEIGGGNEKWAELTRIRLTDAAIDALTSQKNASNEAQIRARFPNWDDLPADAQLATLSMAWACGAHGVDWEFPKFDAALLAGDLSECAVQCHMEDSRNPGLVPRNAANAALFRSAASGADPDSVHWTP